ncbi:MAG: prepilin-type N-terminal cleavage/methylation domain-containing protein [Candidatus Pacebacteria bacterium]|nr:prepilin-type N-terminal cleavage/methylation domain-containing protein [Candidatus Paceibacterota bacterium]
MINLKHILIKKENGFTLVEMMVVVVIFSIVIGAALAVFVYTIRIQQYCLGSQQLLDQTSYAMEYMSRHLRMAKKDISGTCIASGKNYEEISQGTKSGIKFLNYRGECHEFYLDSSDYKLKESRNGSVSDLTSSNLKVNNFNVSILGDGADSLQPKVTILINAQSKKSASTFKPSVGIQTTVSQRNLDY